MVLALSWFKVLETRDEEMDNYHVMLSSYHLADDAVGVLPTEADPSAFIYSHSIELQFHVVLVLCLVPYLFHLNSHQR